MGATAAARQISSAALVGVRSFGGCVHSETLDQSQLDAPNCTDQLAVGAPASLERVKLSPRHHPPRPEHLPAFLSTPIDSVR